VGSRRPKDQNKQFKKGVFRKKRTMGKMVCSPCRGSQSGGRRSVQVEQVLQRGKTIAETKTAEVDETQLGGQYATDGPFNPRPRQRFPEGGGKALWGECKSPYWASISRGGDGPRYTGINRRVNAEESRLRKKKQYRQRC